MELTIVEFWYLIGIVFTAIIGTLVSLILYKVLKILDVITEWVNIYNRVKQVFSIYEQIPSILLESIKNLIFGKK